MIKYNYHCDYTWCVTVYLINCHRYNRNDDCGKSLEASSKISGGEVTFVHNWV